MKIRIVSALCTLTLCGAVPFALGTSPPAVTNVLLLASIEGTILRVDVENQVFTLKTADEQIQISVTNATEFTLDGKKSSMSEALRAGRSASVTHADGTASRVTVIST